MDCSLMKNSRQIQLEVKKLKARLNEIHKARLGEMGKNILNRRKELSMTQQEVAYFSNITRTQICNIELGKSKISLDTLLNLCDTLETTPNELLGF